MKNRKYTLSFMMLFVFMISLSSASAYHSTNKYGRYDDENPRYHCYKDSYYKCNSYSYSNPYRKHYINSDRYRNYYYRYHPLTYYPRYPSNLRNNPINIRIVNSDNVEVRIY